MRYAKPLQPAISQRVTGLTLVELIVTLSVTAVIVTYAIPGLQVIVADNRQTSTINRFVTSVLLARSMAINQRSETTLCPSIDGHNCHNENDWSFGWIVVRQTQDATGHELVHVERGTSDVVLSVNRTRFQFRPWNKRSTNGTAVFCVRNASRPKAVIVSYNGRPRTSHERPDGLALECTY